jgi:small subunit ribosomal protein S6
VASRVPYSHAALPATTERQYELILMLDPDTSDEQREKIASDARTRIESGGALKHDESWGMRKMAYDINQRTEADYRFYRFVGERPLLDELDHNLKITDGVLRFRIFRVDPRAPLITPPDPSAVTQRAPRRGDRRDGASDAPEPTEPAAEGEAAPPADAPAADAGDTAVPAEAPAEPAPESEEAPAESAAEVPEVAAEPAEAAESAEAD